MEIANDTVFSLPVTELHPHPLADGSKGGGEATTNMSEIRDEMAARCGFPTSVLDFCYKEGCTDVLDQIIGPERNDLYKNALSL